MYKKNALSEAEKLRIVELCRTTDLSPSYIADALGVSARTIRRYKNYPGEEAIDSIDVTKKPSYSITGDQWECKKCGYRTDRKVNICPRCQTGPFDSIFTKIGSPEHIPFVKAHKEPETTESVEDFCDPTKDYWACQECNHISNVKFDQCPECGCEDVIFAPNGIEPKTDQEEDNDETPDNEEESEEFDYECQACGHEFNGRMKYCPNCGVELVWD